MKNYEKYAEEIKEYEGSNFCKDFIAPHVLNSFDCAGVSCRTCRMLQMIWLMEDYKEPEVNWSKVEVDTPILVRDTEYDEWEKKHFAAYDGGIGIIYTWNNGNTSSTSEGNMMAWKYAKLAESEKGGAR